MKIFFRLSLCISLLALCGQVWAGGAIQTNIDGLPLLWSVGKPLIYNMDGGGLKTSNPLYTSENTRLIIQEAFEAWTPFGNLTVQEGPLLGGGVDVNHINFGDFLGSQGTEPCYPNIFGELGGECISPIIFDEDGGILASLFGQCAEFSILGFAGFDDVDDGSSDLERRIVRRGQALFSGACLPDSQGETVFKPGCGQCQRKLSDEEIRIIITHEVGHMMGMDHSQVHPEVFTECNLQGGCPPEFSDVLPIMFPILVKGHTRTSAHTDDQSYFRVLYGEPEANHCTVTGRVFADDGTTEVRGVEVVAKNVNLSTELTDAISFISGAEAPKSNSFSRKQGNCEQDGGLFRISGLSPGETYQLCVQRINSQFTGGSSIEPVDPPFQFFTNDCPEGLTVTCECPEDGDCPELSGFDITTDANPDNVDECGSEPSNIQDQDGLDGNGNSSGGCSLHKPLKSPTFLWDFLTKSLL